jgi:hypothetical protein
VFQQAAGEGIIAVAGGRQHLEARGVVVEQPQRQAAQGFVGEVLFEDRPQVRKHLRSRPARVFEEVAGVEAIGAVGRLHGPDVEQFVELRAVALVFGVDRADLVELPGRPVIFTSLEPGAVCPRHVGDNAGGVAKTAEVVRLALDGAAARLLG